MTLVFFKLNGHKITEAKTHLEQFIEKAVRL